MRKRGQRRWRKCRRERQSAWQHWKLIAIALALNACVDSSSPQSIYDRIQPLRRANRYSEALKQAERGLRLNAHDRNSRWYWSFYLEKAEIVMQRDGAEPAIKLLENAVIPDHPDLLELRARKDRDRAG